MAHSAEGPVWAEVWRMRDREAGGWGARDCQRPRDTVELGARTGLGALLVSRPAPEGRVIQIGQSPQRWERGWGQGHLKLVAGRGPEPPSANSGPKFFLNLPSDQGPESCVGFFPPF